MKHLALTLKYKHMYSSVLITMSLFIPAEMKKYIDQYENHLL